VKDFPVEMVPHMNEHELRAYRDIKRKHDKSRVNTQRLSQQSPLISGSLPSIIESGHINDLRNRANLFESQDTETFTPNIINISTKLLKPTHFDKLQVTCFDILDAFKEIEHEETARLIGLLAHFIYWVVFGSNANLSNPLNSFHLKQLFISIL